MPLAYETILDSINEGVFTVDLDWRITSFNRAAEQITGVQRQEALGRKCYEVFRADLCENACPLKKSYAAGRPVLKSSGHIISNRGKSIPIQISAALMRDASGATIGGVETFQDLSQIEHLQKALLNQYTFEDIVGRSPAMRQLFEMLPPVAESTSTVLIEGESGTGKELFARALHNLSFRKKQPFIAVNCAAIPDTLLESELFGYKKGAFTGAQQDKAGRFALADKGTLFLDEIGDISPALQVRLLRVLQERRLEPLGSTRSTPVDVRVVAATNKSLQKLISKGLFREDLYYRIRVIHLRVPPLRDRKEDIPLLVDSLLARYNRLQGKQVSGLTVEALSALMRYDFPGNVRELENILEHAFVLCRDGLIDLSKLPAEFQTIEGISPQSMAAQANPHLSLREIGRRRIEEALARNQGNRRQTASELGVDASTLYRKILHFGIPIPNRDGRGKRPESGP